MKGVVFTELLRMAEETFGEDLVDEVLDSCDLESGGAYTAVGTYPCSELIAIVQALSTRSGIDGEVLQQKFGHWMMESFSTHYPQFFEDKASAFDLLEAVDGQVHVEVRKIYPDAELPRFLTERLAPNELEMRYTSSRPLVAFCHGLIEASLETFEEHGEIMRDNSEDATSAVFRVRTTG